MKFPPVSSFVRFHQIIVFNWWMLTRHFHFILVYVSNAFRAFLYQKMDLQQYQTISIGCTNRTSNNILYFLRYLTPLYITTKSRCVFTYCVKYCRLIYNVFSNISMRTCVLYAYRHSCMNDIWYTKDKDTKNTYRQCWDSGSRYNVLENQMRHGVRAPRIRSLFALSFDKLFLFWFSYLKQFVFGFEGMALCRWWW